MGLFKRVRNIFKAKGNVLLDKIENPAELLDQRIRDMEDNLNKAKLSAANVLGNLHEIEKLRDVAEKEAKNFDEKVRLALKKGNEELAKKALAKKLEADKKFDTLKKQYDTAYINSEKLKGKLTNMESEISKTRSRRDELIARYENAKASEEINEILSDIDAGHNSISMSEIERKIQKKESLADGLEDIANIKDPLEKQFDELASPDIDEELEKYKNDLK